MTPKPCLGALRAVILGIVIVQATPSLSRRGFGFCRISSVVEQPPCKR